MNNIIKFRRKPKKIKLENIDSIGILFKDDTGVLIPKRLFRKILEVLKFNGADFIDR